MSLVSIIMPVYNGEKYLHLAIESVLAQTYNNFELIIINDGSTDNSEEIIKSYNDIRIKQISYEKNIGYVYRLNEGLRISKGEYIARIDADDIWEEIKLTKQLESFENDKNLFFLATDFNLIDAKGDVINTVRNSKHLDLNNKILTKSLICHSSVLFKKEICQTVGYYDEKLKYSEDYNYWIRILAEYKGLILSEILTSYRITNNSVSFRKRRLQIVNTIKSKFLGFKIIGFRLIYLIYLIGDVYRLIIPNWGIRLKRRYISKNNF